MAERKDIVHVCVFAVVYEKYKVNILILQLFEKLINILKCLSIKSLLDYFFESFARLHCTNVYNFENLCIFCIEIILELYIF